MSKASGSAASSTTSGNNAASCVMTLVEPGTVFVRELSFRRRKKWYGRSVRAIASTTPAAATAAAAGGGFTSATCVDSIDDASLVAARESTTSVSSVWPEVEVEVEVEVGTSSSAGVRKECAKECALGDEGMTLTSELCAPFFSSGSSNGDGDGSSSSGSGSDDSSQKHGGAVAVSATAITPTAPVAASGGGDGRTEVEDETGALELLQCCGHQTSTSSTQLVALEDEEDHRHYTTDTDDGDGGGSVIGSVIGSDDDDDEDVVIVFENGPLYNTSLSHPPHVSSLPHDGSTGTTKKRGRPRKTSLASLVPTTASVSSAKNGGGLGRVNIEEEGAEEDCADSDIDSLLADHVCINTSVDTGDNGGVDGCDEEGGSQLKRARREADTGARNSGELVAGNMGSKNHGAVSGAAGTSLFGLMEKINTHHTATSHSTPNQQYRAGVEDVYDTRYCYPCGGSAVYMYPLDGSWGWDVLYQKNSVVLPPLIVIPTSIPPTATMGAMSPSTVSGVGSGKQLCVRLMEPMIHPFHAASHPDRTHARHSHPVVPAAGRGSGSGCGSCVISGDCGYGQYTEMSSGGEDVLLAPPTHIVRMMASAAMSRCVEPLSSACSLLYRSAAGVDDVGGGGGVSGCGLCGEVDEGEFWLHNTL
jgi:hypothetical protein